MNRATYTCALASIMAGAFAAQVQAGEINGAATLVQVTAAVDQTKTADGGTSYSFQNKGVILSNDTTSPSHLAAQNCDGVQVVSADMKTFRASGSCHVTDKQGDRYDTWWTSNNDGSTWGVLDGTGKYAGMTGGGKFDYTLLLQDRSVLAIDGTLTMK